VDGSHHHHPEVEATDWCGEWKSRLDADKEKTPDDKR
jgi:hypothetical protein